MNVYKLKNEKHYRFAIVLSVGPSRKQHVVNTSLTGQRAATEVMRKTQLLAESVEAQIALTPELRRWLESMNPKLRKRLTKLGLIGDADAAASQGVAEHVEDYLRDCLAQGHGNPFVKIKRSQLTAFIKHAGVTRLSDITPDRAATFFANLRETGRSNRTRNQHRATLIAWLNWCVSRQRLDQHRIDTIPRLNEELNRSRRRRAAIDEEVDRLLAVMPPRRRRVVLAALFTGLRRGELNRIERRDIDLERKTLHVRPEVSKTRQAVTLPLHDDLILLLTEHVQGLAPEALVFKPVPQMKTFRRDMAKAGIDYKDTHGRQLDFHALRATFTTRLLRSGFHPSIARQYTRHSSVVTLEKHYDMLGFVDAQCDINKLPGFKSAG